MIKLNASRWNSMAKLALKEAEKLKENLTRQEKNNLNWAAFSPEDNRRCIYGQIAFDCYSERATELIFNCCERTYDAGPKFSNNWITNATLNGKPKLEKLKSIRRSGYHSPIEVLILQKNGELNGRRIISYLKGETTTIEFISPFKK